MKIKKVEVEIRESEIVELLSQGYTWLKKDDLGYGSIQEKYAASEKQVLALQSDPCFNDVSTTVRTLVFIKDLKKSEPAKQAAPVIEQLVESPVSVEEVEANDAADIFANL